MEIENEFTVDAPVQQAWEAMLDLERVAPCLPGASIEEATGEEYQGTMAVKLGPISARYRGTVRVEETDEESHRAVLRANGKETRGQGSASATITTTMNEENGATRVRVETDIQVTGRVAQFGRGIMQDVATELMDRFSTCVEQEIVGGGAEQEPEQPAATTSADGSPDGTTRSQREQAAEAREQETASVEESSGADTQEPKTRKITPREAEPLDLGTVSREAVIKRAAPVLAGLAGLALAAVLIRKRQRPSFLLSVNRFEIRMR
jgi:carbon monoxide dehydrogenase subunit G